MCNIHEQLRILLFPVCSLVRFVGMFRIGGGIHNSSVLDQPHVSKLPPVKISPKTNEQTLHSMKIRDLVRKTGGTSIRCDWEVQLVPVRRDIVGLVNRMNPM